jgi:hypothetical protein
MTLDLDGDQRMAREDFNVSNSAISRRHDRVPAQSQ